MSKALEEAKAAVPEEIEKKSSHKSIAKQEDEAQTELTAEILAQLESTVEELRAQLRDAEERLANQPQASNKSLSNGSKKVGGGGVIAGKPPRMSSK